MRSLTNLTSRAHPGNDCLRNATEKCAVFHGNTELKYGLYLVLGFMACLLNLLLIYAIFSQRKSRNSKEYVVIAGLSFADATEGFATCIGGLYRLEIHRNISLVVVIVKKTAPLKNAGRFMKIKRCRTPIDEFMIRWPSQIWY